MSMKEFGIAFMLAGKLSNDFSKTFNTANKALKGCGEQISSLNKKAQNIGGVVKLRQETGQAARAYIQATQKVAELGRAISATSAPTQKMIAEFNREKKALKRAKTELDKKRVALKEMESAAGTASAKLSDLITKEKRLAAAAERAAKAQAKIAKASQLQDTLRGGAENSKSALLGMTAVLGNAVGAPVKTAMDFEDQQAELRKFSDEYAEMHKSIQDLTLKYGKSAADMTQMASAAMQSGIATTNEEVVKLIEAQTQGAVAFGMTGDEIGEAWASIQSKMGLTVDQTKDAFDIINLLGNKTTASSKDIVDVLQRQGGTLKGLTALNEKQIVALAGAFRSASSSSEVAATSMAAFVGRLTNGEAATKAQKDALGKLGLDAGTLAKQLTSSSGEAQKAIETVFERINKLSPDKQGAVIGQLFGNEAGIKAAVATLAKSSKMLGGNFEYAGDKTQYAGSMMQEYMARADTTSEVVAIAGNAFTLLNAKLGQSLLPTIRTAATDFIKMASSTAKWVSENQSLIFSALKVAGAVTGALVAFHAGRIVLSLLISPIISVYKGFQNVKRAIDLARNSTLLHTVATKTSSIAMKAWSVACKAAAVTANILKVAVRALGVAMKFLFTNPVGLAILAVTALIAAGVLLYKNWDTVKAKAAELWAKVKGAFSDGIESIKTWLANFSLFESGKKIIDTLVSGIKSMASAPVQAVQGAFSKVRDMLPFSDAKVGPLSELTKSGQAIMSTIGSGIKKAGSTALTSPFEESTGGMFRLIDSLSKPAGGAKTGGSISVSFAPVINISGGGGDAYAQVKKGLAEGQNSLKKELERLLRDQQRLSYV